MLFWTFLSEYIKAAFLVRIIEEKNRKFEPPDYHFIIHDLDTYTELHKFINHMISSFTDHIHNHKDRNVWVHKYFEICVPFAPIPILNIHGF